MDSYSKGTFYFRSRIRRDLYFNSRRWYWWLGVYTGHFKDQAGNLFFGSIEGVIRIPANFTSTSINPPPLYITDVDIYQEPLNANRLIYNDSELELAYEDNFIGFRVVALDYDSPQKLKYSYKLEGFDKEWVAADNRDYISYSNLDPGNKP